MLQKSHALLPGLLLIGVLVLLSGCGLGAGIQPSADADGQPGPLVIAYYPPQPEEAPQTARVGSADTAQRIYNAMLVLPRKQQCEPLIAISPTYRLVFHMKQQVIPASIDSNTCQTVTLNGETHALTDEFTRSFSTIVAGVTFARAEPDYLTLTTVMYSKNTAGGPSETQQENIVGDTTLALQLYHKVLTLQPSATRPDCQSADSAVGRGRWYRFAFSQWDLPSYEFSAYDGSCQYVVRSARSQPVQGDQALWDLIHRAASQP